MFNNMSTSGLSLGKILSGFSKTLNIANQIIPLYKEMKPVLANGKSIVNSIKKIGVNSFKSQALQKEKGISVKENASNNNPVFFN